MLLGAYSAGNEFLDRSIVWRRLIARTGKLQRAGPTREQRTRLKVSHDGADAAVPGHGHHFAKRNTLAVGFDDEART